MAWFGLAPPPLGRLQRPASGDSEIGSAATSGDSEIGSTATATCAPVGASGETVELQAQPGPSMHLVAQLIQALPQAQLPLQTMQHPVDSSWQLPAARETAARARNRLAAKDRVKRGKVRSILDDWTVFV